MFKGEPNLFNFFFQVEFELDNGVKMVVNFEKMVQKNKKTGWERPIRIALKDDADDSKL